MKHRAMGEHKHEVTRVPRELKDESMIRSKRDKERSYTMKALAKIGAPAVACHD